MKQSTDHAFSQDTRLMIGVYGSMLVTAPLIVLLLTSMIIRL